MQAQLDCHATHACFQQVTYGPLYGTPVCDSAPLLALPWSLLSRPSAIALLGPFRQRFIQPLGHCGHHVGIMWALSQPAQPNQPNPNQHCRTRTTSAVQQQLIFQRAMLMPELPCSVTNPEWLLCNVYQRHVSAKKACTHGVCASVHDLCT